MSILGNGRDITKRKEAEEESARLARFPSENPNPVLRINPHGTILYANAASDCLLSAWETSVGGKLPWATDDIANACAAANRLIELHDGDVRNTIRTLDEYHRDHGDAFSITSPWSLRNAIPRYLAERKGSEVIELRI